MPDRGRRWFGASRPRRGSRVAAIAAAPAILFLAASLWAAGGQAAINLGDTASRQDCAPPVALILSQPRDPRGRPLGIEKDAADMAETLRRAGAEVEVATSLDPVAALEKVRTLAARDPGRLRVLYFAGSGGDEASAPGQLWFMREDDVDAPPGPVAPDFLARRALPFDLIASEIGRDGHPSLLIVDSSLGDVPQRMTRQTVLLSGNHGRGDEGGGYFTQPLVAAMRRALDGPEPVELGRLFAEAATRAADATRGVEDPVMMVRSSSPEISLGGGRLHCRIAPPTR